MQQRSRRCIRNSPRLRTNSVKRRILLAALLGAGLTAPAAAKDCDFLPKAPAPAWVSGSPVEKGFYTGVGQAPAENEIAAQGIERAKQAALRDLASNIEVFVRNETRVKEKAAGTPDELQSRIEFESSTETAASALLADVQTDPIWLDRRACVVWTRVKVEEPVVKALQRKQTELAKLKLLKSLIATAEDSASAVETREKSLEQAAGLFPRIDYSHATDGSNESLFRRAIEKLRETLAKARGRFEINAKDFAEAEAQLQRARREDGIAAQAQIATRAKTLLTKVAASAPYNAAPDFWPEKATLALAEFERDTGNPCESKYLLRELERRSSDADWQERAVKAQDGLSCRVEERQTQSLRRLVYGREVTLLCAYKLGAKPRAWDRVCADTQALLASHGALRVSVPDADPAQQAQWVEKCRNGCQEAALAQDLAIVMFAQGSMATRNNKENPMGRDHQFKGQVTSYVLNKGKAEFNDQYNGIGGWNPVSADMAMDVLAIQAGNRFREKAAAHYQSGR